MNKLEETNNLAFDLTNEELEPYDYFQITRKVYNLSKPFKLNENQQIVLDWLKAYSDSDNGDKPISSIGYMMHLIRVNVLEKSVRNAYFELTRKQQFEVLQVFAEWGLGHD